MVTVGFSFCRWPLLVYCGTYFRAAPVAGSAGLLPMKKNLLSVGFVVVAAFGGLLTLQPTPPVTSTEARLVAPAATIPEPLAVGQAITARQTGRLHELYAHEGQHVRQGQLLAKILIKTASVPQLQLTNRLNQQQLAYATLLAGQPAADPAALAEARQQRDATRQQLDQLVPMLSFGYVMAPADGLITRTLVRLGDRLTPASVVVRLADLPRPDTTQLLTRVD